LGYILSLFGSSPILIDNDLSLADHEHEVFRLRGHVCQVANNQHAVHTAVEAALVDVNIDLYTWRALLTMLTA